MKLEVRNGDLEEILLGLKNAMTNKTSLPVKVSYRIVKNRLAIENALIAFRVTRDEIRGSNSNGEGKISEKDDPETFDKVRSEISAIAQEKVSVDISKVSISEFGERELPPDLVSNLGFMIEE